MKGMEFSRGGLEKSLVDSGPEFCSRRSGTLFFYFSFCKTPGSRFGRGEASIAGDNRISKPRTDQMRIN